MSHSPLQSAALISLFFVSLNLSSAEPPFSGPDDIAFAERLWQALESNRLIGANRFKSMPYKTPPPHGHHVETIDGTIKIDDREGIVIVKQNFGKNGEESRQEIAENPDDYLTSITVMFKREDGYDEDNKNWFWAKYFPDGKLFKNPKDMALAGRVAKGANSGCLSCHTGAPGGDYVFIHNRFAE